jgi:Putative prokaryotic signal transducing protein
MAPPDSSTRLVMIFGTAAITEGLLVKGMLESEGIPVQLKGESEGPYRTGPVSLWVPESYEVQARMILEEATSGRYGEAEDEAEGAVVEDAED